MTAVHITLGVALVAVNLAAARTAPGPGGSGAPRPASGRCCAPDRRSSPSRRRSAACCCSPGEDLPPLHLVYGLTPLGVAFFAEQLRLVAAQTELDRRELEGRDAVAALPRGRAAQLVQAILRREIGVMAASALVVALLGVRASGWI